LLVLCLGSLAPAVQAADIGLAGDFNLQVTPSPLVATVKPGVKSQLELKIRNSGSSAEDLKIEPRAFKYNSRTGDVSLDADTPPPVAPWIAFSAPRFTAQPGQWIAETVTLNIPKDAGFSYSFALVISRQSLPKNNGGTRVIAGSLAVFTLINVDRPGAKSSLQVVQFTASRHLYEYLPATFAIRFRNTGNTIVQPYGNMFVQRTATNKTPLATLAINDKRGYILPGTERSVTTQWNDGFAAYMPVAQPDGTTRSHLAVDWSKLSHFRIGRYTAKLVAVYSDGQHDVPIEGTVTFWVVPWRAILLFIGLLVGLWFLGRWRGKRRTAKAVKRALAAQAAATGKSPHPASHSTSEDTQS
jgi:hypothetical protein